jgi:hypothetical protein
MIAERGRCGSFGHSRVTAMAIQLNNQIGGEKAMTTPLEFYTKPWTGWDKKDGTSKDGDSNPFLDPFFEKIDSAIKGYAHDAFKPVVCNGLVNAAVNDGLIDSATGRAILPVVELVYDKVSPI